MVNTVITVADSLENPGLEQLATSTEKFGWNLVVINAPWRGFGTKLIETYNYLKTNPDLKNFVFVDAYDVVALSDPNEFSMFVDSFKDKMVVSCEKACWPDSSLVELYPESNSEWKYINSGTYYAPSELFIEIFDSSPAKHYEDDQLWLTNRYLSAFKNSIMLDDGCILFQCYSHIADDDFEYDYGRLKNLKTKTFPIFIHGNGRTDMSKIKELL